MKILVVINSLSAGGAESFAAALCKEYRSREIPVALFLFAGILDEKGRALAVMLEQQGVTIIVPPSRRLLIVLATLCRITLQYSPNVIHSHLEQSDLLVWLTGKLLFFKKIRRVRTLHNVHASERIPKLAHRFLRSGFDVDIACSGAALQRFPFLNATRVCIQNGIDWLDLDSLQNLDLRRLFNLPNNSIVLVCVGSFTIDNGVLRKAQNVIVDALAMLRDPKLCVIFLGDGPEKNVVEQQALQLGVASQCVFAGIVPNVCEYLKACDALIMPSIYEGMPIACLEAVMCGTPMILSQIDALLPFESPATVFVQPGNADELAEKLSNLATRLGDLRRAAAVVRTMGANEYSIARSADRYLMVYSASALQTTAAKLQHNLISNKPQILLNATTLNRGGAIQAVVSFIRVILEDVASESEFDWIFAVSPEVREQLLSYAHPLRPEQDICIEKSPSKCRKSRRQLQLFAAQRADAVFTFFGPSYIKFPCPHLCGAADGWVTHAGRQAYSILPNKFARLKMLLRSIYKGVWFRTADAWVVELAAAGQGLVQRWHLPSEGVHIVANNCAQGYWALRQTDAGPLAATPPKRILCFASDYPHKCLQLIPQVAAQLIHRHGITDFTFVTTLPQQAYADSEIVTLARQLNVERHIENIGYVPLQAGPALYQSCQISFLPSVLETFSATYPESMCMGLPIVTSDLDFARSVCESAALYFKPLCASAAAAQIARLIESEPLRRQYIVSGVTQVQKFPTPHEKYAMYSEIIRKLLVQRT